MFAAFETQKCFNSTVFDLMGYFGFLGVFTKIMYHCMYTCLYLDRVKRIWFLSSMRAAKVQASLRIRAVSPELSLLAHTSSESRGTFRQKPRSLAPLNSSACAVKICHDGMLEDTNSLDGAHLMFPYIEGSLFPNQTRCSVSSDLYLHCFSGTDKEGT